MNDKNKIAFLVLSCDNYSDLWSMFIHQFEKNWPDCKMDKFFVTNHKSIPKSSFNEIKIGDDISWSDCLMKALSQLKENYTHVLITLEDLPLIKKVDNKKFNSILEDFFKIEAKYLKFIRKPQPTKKFNQDFGVVEAGSLYRPTCVYALWELDTFLNLLRAEENAWEFERYGSVRSDKIEGFYVVYHDFFKVLNTVVKGKWVPSELKKIKELGCNIKVTRDVFSNYESLKLKFNSIFFSLFTKLIPWRLRRKIVFSLKKL